MLPFGGIGQDACSAMMKNNGGENGSVEELFIQGHAKVASDAAPASSAPAAVSTASSVEEVSAMDGYDYLNDYIGLHSIIAT